MGTSRVGNRFHPLPSLPRIDRPWAGGYTPARRLLMAAISARAVWAVLAAVVAAAGPARGQDPPPAAPDLPAAVTAGPSPAATELPTPQKDDPVLRAGQTGLGGPGGATGLGGLGGFTGMGGFGGFGGAGLGGGAVGGPGYTAIFYPARPVSGQGTDLTLVRQNAGGAVPVWRDGGDTLLVTAGVRNDLFSTNAVLPDTGRPFPTALWSVNGGVTYVHQFSGGWTGGLMTNFGSASDQPFHSIHEMTVSTAGFIRMPARNDRDEWMFSLMYSPVGLLNFPVPGVAYVWNPSDQLRVSIGLPFSVAWRPVEDLTLTLAYVPLTNVTARATYRVAERAYVYGGFEWLNESYFLADRADVRD